MRKSGFACRVRSSRPIARTRAHSASSRKSMKRARPYLKSSPATSSSFRLGEDAAGRAAEPRRARDEAFGVLDAALQAAVAGRRPHLLDDVDSVVVAQPCQLALVRLEHRPLRVEGRSHV